MTSEVNETTVGRVPINGSVGVQEVSTARVVSSAGKKLSIRKSYRATSCAVPKVVTVENKRSVELFHL